MAGIRLYWVVGAIGALLLTGVCKADEDVSAAEKLLFDRDHLGNITAPVRLVYAYQKGGSLEAAVADEVDLDVEPLADGSKTVSPNFLTGERKQDFPAMEHVKGNPVLLYFLERDIREMQRLTGGMPVHFQRRIRLALAGNPPVRSVSVQVNGRAVPAQEVTVTPYLDDPARSRFEKFSGKSYTFTISEGVPGGIYQLRATTPGQGQALLDETLTYARSERGK